jgi:dihydroxyacetone kinase-like predicted kinase
MAAIALSALVTLSALVPTAAALAAVPADSARRPLSPPSAEELLAAYRAANAETVFVFPNNGNVILAAKQAGNFCDDISVRVIETRNVGEGYAALSMADFSSDNADEVEAILYENMKGVLTGEIAMCVRDADIGEVSVKEGDYIGYVGKKILSHDTSRLEAAKCLADGLALDEHSLCLVFYGEDADEAECGEIASYIESKYPACEVYAIRGGQAIYSYIMVAE